MATKRPELCRDPVWMRDAVSKFLESPVYSVPLLDFIDENCGMFEDSDDNKLEYTIVHENFKELVDGLISDFLSSLGIPVPTFVQMFAIEEHSSLYSIVVTSILIVDDFLLFKEMMLKRNFQISNQALSRMASQAHALQVPDHLSDVSKQRQLSDKEAAKSLSFAEAFQKQSKVNNVDLDPVTLPDTSQKLVEDHAGLGDQREESDDELKGKDAITHSLNTDHVTLTQILDPPDTPDISFQNKETIMKSLISSSNPVTSSNYEKEPPRAGEVQNPEHKIEVSLPATPENEASSRENRRETTSTMKVSFREAVIMGDPPLEQDSEELIECLDEAKYLDEERQDQNEEKAPELSSTTYCETFEDLYADINEWKLKSLKSLVNDGDIQQRRRYLQQQRDRILAHKKSAREKQLRFFRQFESKAEAPNPRPKRSTQPTPTLPRDTEANRKRETLRKELARCLKEELTNKTSRTSITSKQIHV
ncbi:uncharacterized protein [Physcomitrium patens]|uniref:uncharacterized protein isoform X2 n=1 Tax=Physcomitrium patens TaxID=3218 RepID=UPI000D164E37|nr:cilia- and flagella-associated protein 36-like isoform X2 [Physcomitrium patens]|eukprot:XP_024357649.1 cilia- and flagella-associated protein 36-like isoform X2 [Physcomitrella patens]